MAKQNLRGIVVKGVGGVFNVAAQQGKFVCFAPKKLRYNDLCILIGDEVEFERLHGNKGNIVEVFPRKNKLARPEVANVDVCFIVVASAPEPDFYLVDKVLVNCFHSAIEPVIVVNKTDLGGKLAEECKVEYGKVCDVLETSAENGNADALVPYINGHVACFAGQSAVGKTSLLNTLCPNLAEKTGGLSEKSGRGTHTTRHASLHSVCGGYVVDTCGFSLCDITDISSDELRLYLDDFVTVAHECKFTSCTHTVEPDCAVKKAALDGTLSKARYDRYLEEYKELVEAERNKY